MLLPNYHTLKTAASRLNPANTSARNDFVKALADSFFTYLQQVNLSTAGICFWRGFPGYEFAAGEWETHTSLTHWKTANLHAFNLLTKANLVHTRALGPGPFPEKVWWCPEFDDACDRLGLQLLLANRPPDAGPLILEWSSERELPLDLRLRELSFMERALKRGENVTGSYRSTPTETTTIVYRAEGSSADPSLAKKMITRCKGDLLELVKAQGDVSLFRCNFPTESTKTRERNLAAKELPAKSAQEGHRFHGTFDDGHLFWTVPSNWKIDQD